MNLLKQLIARLKKRNRLDWKNMPVATASFRLNSIDDQKQLLKIALKRPELACSALGYINNDKYVARIIRWHFDHFIEIDDSDSVHELQNSARKIHNPAILETLYKNGSKHLKYMLLDILDEETLISLFSTAKGLDAKLKIIFNVDDTGFLLEQLSDQSLNIQVRYSILAKLDHKRIPVEPFLAEDILSSIRPGDRYEITKALTCMKRQIPDRNNRSITLNSFLVNNRDAIYIDEHAPCQYCEGTVESEYKPDLETFTITRPCSHPRERIIKTVSESQELIRKHVLDE